jgi:hypothetical protein
MIEDRTAPEETVDRWLCDCIAGGGAELTVRGSCMEPALRDGQRVRLCRRDRLRVGDVVLVRTPAGLRLHRIVLRYGEVLRTKGDHGPYLDPPAQPPNVLATCDTDERASLRWARVFMSLAALGGRLRGGRDEEHARLLR